MQYNIKDISLVLGIKTLLLDHNISELLTDSRKVNNPAASLFFALVTKNNDAHIFISELYDAGVRNFVVSEIFPEWAGYKDANFLKVADTLRALQKVAAWHRSQFDIPVIGITGSNGKTIVKEWLYQLLGDNYNIVRSPRSYNSQVGVPLSVWQMDKSNELAIFEAGISLTDEMLHLEPIIRPTIGIFTNIGSAHQENFESIGQKCCEKMELFANCDVVIYDADDPVIEDSAERMLLSQRAFVWSRIDTDAHLYIPKIISTDNETVIHYSFLHFDYDVTIPFVDSASVENAIICLAIMLYLNVAPEEISKRMSRLEPVAMRLDVRQGKNKCSVINDSYNSDINSIRIALDFQNQRNTDHSLKKTLILSDILQSGMSRKELYEQVNQMIEAAGITKLIGVGEDISANAELLNIQDKSFYKTTDDFINSGEWKYFRNELILLKGARQFHFERINQLIELRIHETSLEVDIDALVHNFNFYKSKLSSQTKLICMVKANGYGSGASEIAKTLQYHRCEYFAVAVADEGIQLRKDGITVPIIVLNPEVNGFEELFSCDLEPEVYNFKILEAFIHEAERRGLADYPVHLKIDTGMHRLGFMKEQVPQLIEAIKSQKGIKIKSIFSHLAASESWIFDDFTNQQINSLIEVHRQIQGGIGYQVAKHILNSAGIERFPNSDWDMARLGIGLYGVSASGLPNLRNICTLKSTILQIKDVLPHETVGYGRKGMLDRQSKIATIRIGYADGLDRQFGNGKGRVLIHGKYAPIVGNICMDICMIDVTDIEAKEGDSVIIFGEQLPVTKMADSIGTIPYEILTSVSPRVKRVYIKE